MSRKIGLTFSIGGLIVWLVLAILLAHAGDLNHARMFVMGSVFWIAAIFVELM